MTLQAATPLESSSRLPIPRQWGWLIGTLLPLIGVGWSLLIGLFLPNSRLGQAATGLVLIVLAICVITDLFWRKIFNWITYPAVLWAVLLQPIPWPTEWPTGTIGLAASLGGAALGFFGMIVGFYLSGSGAGDVKLGAALGAWLGPLPILSTLIATYAIAGIVVLSWMVWEHGPVSVGKLVLRRLGYLLLPGLIAPPSPELSQRLERPVPMSPFFAAGTLVVLGGWL